MIKLVAMHPEVWFMDVTSSVNKQKSDLFMLAIRTPSGKTFPGNFTFIPSGRSWVFQTIYQYAFTSLFGTTVCSYNRLALFDDDFAERGPFESCIATLPHFGKSRVMLCVFHAVWMPFKEGIMKFITARFKDSSGLLTKLGREIGECKSFITYSCLYIHGYLLTWYCSAEFLKNFFIRQCNTYVTKAQYDRSHEILSEWLSNPYTVYVLDVALVEQIKMFQAHLMSKEKYLAHHIRVNITMCADAMTTSPVESMNDLTKNTFGIGANMNLSTSVVALVEDHGGRYERFNNSMLLKMDSTNLASRAPTKQYIQKQCQHMIDHFHDISKYQKCVQLNKHEWICWNFFDPEEKKRQEELHATDGVGIDEEVQCVYEKTLRRSMVLPHFLNVYRVRVCTFDGTLFLYCSCRHFERLVSTGVL